MSTLEKAVILLKEMPEQSVEAVYRFMQTIQTQPYHAAPLSEDMPQSIKGLQVLQSFA